MGSQEKIMEKLQAIQKERGKNSLELTRKIVIEEKIESKEVREALNYFIIEYYHNIFRPTLFSLVCEAVGSDPNLVTPIAIPMSLISAAIDIHDDIIDQSQSKFGQPTVFGKFGKNTAILAGDVLLFKGFTLINEATKKGISVEKIAFISNIIKKTFFELGNAVAIELQYRERTDVSSEEYLRMVRMKAADVEATTRVSSIVGNGTKKEIEALSEYGRLLGTLQILNCDLIDMLDFEEFMNRVNNEHLPLQVIYALEKSTNKREIDLIIQRKKKTKSDVNKIVKFTNKAEGPVFVAEKMKSIANKAINHLQNIKRNKDYLQLFVEVLVPLVIENGG